MDSIIDGKAWHFVILTSRGVGFGFKGVKKIEIEKLIRKLLRAQLDPGCPRTVRNDSFLFKKEATSANLAWCGSCLKNKDQLNIDVGLELRNSVIKELKSICRASLASVSKPGT